MNQAYYIEDCRIFDCPGGIVFTITSLGKRGERCIELDNFPKGLRYFVQFLKLKLMRQKYLSKFVAKHSK